MRISIAIFAVCSLFVSVASASKEGILPLSSFRLESPGIGGSGPVIVEGSSDNQGQLAAFTISAFGRRFEISAHDLAKLHGLPANGLRISYEHGYRELGGRTIYVQLQMGFTSFTKKEALITLTEDGKVEVSDVLLKTEPNQVPLPTPASVTPAANAPVVPPSGAAGH